MIQKCKWCGKEFETHNSSKYCSDHCREQRRKYWSKWAYQYDGRHWDDREERFKIWLKRNGYETT